jgi:hypothetical protein
MSSRLEEGFEPCAPLHEGMGPQVIVALGQKVVGADMGGNSLSILASPGLRLSRCCSTLKLWTHAIAQDQQLAVDRAIELGQRIDDRSGKAPPRHPRRSASRGATTRLPSASCRRRPGRGCRPISTRRRTRRHRACRNHRPRWHARASAGGRAPDRVAVGTRCPALQPGEQIGVGRLEPVPDELDLVGLHRRGSRQRSWRGAPETPMRRAPV